MREIVIKEFVQSKLHNIDNTLYFNKAIKNIAVERN